MAEAMACGTPVLATPFGAVPEVVVDGVTGFIRDTADELATLVDRLGEIDRHACRAHVETYFSAAAMATGYERLYAQLIADRAHHLPFGLDAPHARLVLPPTGG